MFKCFISFPVLAEQIQSKEKSNISKEATLQTSYDARNTFNLLSDHYDVIRNCDIPVQNTMLSQTISAQDINSSQYELSKAQLLFVHLNNYNDAQQNPIVTEQPEYCVLIGDEMPNPSFDETVITELHNRHTFSGLHVDQGQTDLMMNNYYTHTGNNYTHLSNNYTQMSNNYSQLGNSYTSLGHPYSSLENPVRNTSVSLVEKSEM